jgi:exodeoxyribonuclease VII large subunit
MARLPFNPKQMKAPESKPIGTAALTVTQVTEEIRTALGQKFGNSVSVIGEVSNFGDRGHWYWTLKDQTNVLGCVMWRSATARCRHALADGQRVRVTGRLDHYGPQGRVQLYAERIEPLGEGDLEQRFRQLCQQLKEEGYFDPEQKKPVPSFPQHLAVITSSGGAAWHDVQRTAQSRWPGIRLTLIDVRVQGDAAAGQIVAALGAVDRNRATYNFDAIVLTRGGGSLEDLWAFNELAVAKAIFSCQLPVIAAIGHETDTTIAELVADLRCSTPTQAAAILVPDAVSEAHRLGQYASRLQTSLSRRVDNDRLRLFTLSTQLPSLIGQKLQRLNATLAGHEITLSRIEPASRLALARLQLKQAAERLTSQHAQRLSDFTRHLGELEKQLKAMGLPSVLARGYSYTTDAKGRPFRSATGARLGQTLITHLQDGKIESQVTASDKPAPPPKKSVDPSGLFD